MRRVWVWSRHGHGLEHSNSGKKSFDSILFDFRYRIDFFDSIRFANLINLPLLHWYSNSNDGEFGEGPGGVSLRCGSFCAISLSIRQFPTLSRTRTRMHGAFSTIAEPLVFVRCWNWNNFFLCYIKFCGLKTEVNKQDAVWFTGRLSFQRCDNLMHFEVYCDELFRFCGIILITGCVTEVCSDVFTGKRD